MSFRKYCRGMSQHEIFDQSILPKANKLKNFFVLKDVLRSTYTINCPLLRKPFIEYSRPLTAAASRHD